MQPGPAASVAFRPEDLHMTRVIDVIKVEHREHARVGPAPSQEIPQVDAVQFLAQRRGHQPPHPFVEVPEHDFRAGRRADR